MLIRPTFCYIFDLFLTVVCRTCLKPAQIILLEDQPDRCNIEIDVEPTYDVCRNEVFFIRRGKDGENEYYIRDGTESKTVGQPLQINFENVVAGNSKERKKQETKFAQGGSPNVDIRLNHTICQGMSKIHDNEFQVGVLKQSQKYLYILSLLACKSILYKKFLLRLCNRTHLLSLIKYHLYNRILN